MSKRLALSKDVSHTKFLMKCKKKKVGCKATGLASRAEDKKCNHLQDA